MLRFHTCIEVSTERRVPHGSRGIAMMAALAVLLLLSGSIALAQSPQIPARHIDAQVRDAAHDAARALLYLAVYDQNAMWVLDADNAALRSQHRTGAGPASLALSADGAFLAVANRLDNTVSIFALDALDDVTTIPVPEGPMQVHSTPNNTFLVTALYADAIVEIDPSSMQASAAIASGSAAPVDAAMLPDGRIAVLGRAQSELAIQDASDANGWRRIALEGEPVGLFPSGHNRLIAATRDGLWLVDTETHTIERRQAMPLRDARYHADALYVLYGGMINTLDAALNLQTTRRLSGEALLLGGDSDYLMALAPNTKTVYLAWQSATMLGVDAHAAPPPEAKSLPDLDEAPSAPLPEPAEEIIIEEAEPIQNAAPAPLPDTGSSEVETNGFVSEQQAHAAQTVQAGDTDADTATNDNNADAEHPAPLSPLVPTASQENQEQPAHPGVTAPSQSAAAPMPMQELSRRTILDALRQPTQFGSPEAGFQAPDWTDPMRYFEADAMEQDIATGDVLLEGNVRLRLGDMYFESDRFDYRELSGMLEARGNIRLEQDVSYLTADRFTYQLPEEDALPERFPFEPPLDAEGRARQRLTMGRVTAQNVLIVEPTREMMAEDIDYDFTTHTGHVLNTKGRADIYYYGAEELHIHGPDCFEGTDVWVTTCDLENPHYRIRLSEARFEDGIITEGSNARLQLGRYNTPLYLPRYRATGFGGHTWNMDFDSGRRAEIGYFVNVGQRLDISPDFSIGPRLFVTQKEGVGAGLDFEYDYMDTPASRLFRTSGEFNSLYTNENRGYLQFYHRYEYDEDLVVRVQAEQWSDQNFYKDFYFYDYRNRTAPRTFANVVYRQPDYFATGTMRLNTHNWMRQTESLPSVGFHILERKLAENLYFALDTQHGYYNRKPDGSQALRTSNQARLTYNWTPAQGLSITPFGELDTTWYSRKRISDETDFRISPLFGVTAQSRFHKTYPGAWGFSGFKHVVAPSITYSYRPDTNWNLAETHRFSALDNTFGRSRIESRLDNIFYGRDAETNEVWQVGRLSLFQGNDFASETIKSEDYEIELDLRPRPWWGFQLVGARQGVTANIGRPFLESLRLSALNLYEDRLGRPYDSDAAFYLGMGNHSRVLAQLYYDELSPESPISGRLGFAYTATQNRKYNRDILYGLGYNFSENWGFSFEHTYDMDSGDLRTQTYEVRRSLHCWEAAIRFRERETGFDIDLTFYIKAFPGSRLKF